MNLKIIVAPIVVLIIGIGVFSFISSDENVEISEDVVVIQSEEPRKLIQTNVPSLFKVMAYENDFEIWDNEFDEIPSDKRNDKHVTKWNTLSARCEPSNRSDMDFLLSAFPLYKIHEHDVWGFDASIDEDENEEIEN